VSWGCQLVFTNFEENIFEFLKQNPFIHQFTKLMCRLFLYFLNSGFPKHLSHFSFTDQNILNKFFNNLQVVEPNSISNMHYLL